MAKHFIREPVASAILGGEAPVVNYDTGLTSDRLFGGQPYSRLGCIAPYLDGENVIVTIPGTVQGLTPELVQESTRRLSFVRVKFSDLVLEIRGDAYNSVSYSGTARSAVQVQPGSQK